MDSQDSPPSSYTPVPANGPIDRRDAAAWLESIERRLAQIKVDAGMVKALPATVEQDNEDTNQIGGS